MGYRDEEESNLGENIKNIGGAIGMCLLAIAGCIQRYEPPSEVARKPPIVQVMRRRSQEFCRIAAGDGGRAAELHDENLVMVLNKTKSEVLDKLVDSNITVCLDTRLAEQKTGFFERDVIGAYYPGARMVTISFNGLEKGVNVGRGSDILRTLTDDFNPSAPGTTVYAGSFRRNCGKGCSYTQVQWKDAADFAGSLNKNPQLVEAPVATVH